MSVDQLAGPSALPALDAGRPAETVRVVDAPFQTAGQLPQVVAGGAVDTVEALLLSVARGDREAFVALQRRMAGLVRVNIRRVLRDATRSDTVTQQTFADVLDDAAQFDPHRDSAQTWLLTRAHQHAIDGLRSADATQAPIGTRIDRSASVSLP